MKKLGAVLALLLVVAIVVASVFGVQNNNLAKELEAVKAELESSKTNVNALNTEVNTAKSELEQAAAKVSIAESSASGWLVR